MMAKVHTWNFELSIEFVKVVQGYSIKSIVESVYHDYEHILHFQINFLLEFDHNQDHNEYNLL
jgi:hypothetical protein